MYTLNLSLASNKINLNTIQLFGNVESNRIQPNIYIISNIVDPTVIPKSTQLSCDLY